MIALLKYWQIGAGVALGCLLASAPVYLYGKSEGRSAANAEIAVSTVKIEKERVTDDAQLQNLSDYDLCKRSLARRGLQLDVCAELPRTLR